MKAAWSQRWLSFDFSSDLALSTWVKGRFEYKQKTKYFPQKVQLNISLRLVAVFPFCCCFAGSLQFSSSRVKYSNYSAPFSGMFFTFARGSKGVTSCKVRLRKAVFWRETHTAMWLLIERTIFLAHEKKSLAILIWLELICVWKFTT